MELETTGFKEGRKNTQFKCGLFTKPYMSTSQCGNLAVALVTDEAYIRYRNYWHKWNRYHYKDELPMMHLKLICQEHIDLIRNLPDNPKTRERSAP